MRFYMYSEDCGSATVSVIQFQCRWDTIALMNRRSCLQALAAVTAVPVVGGAAPGKPIQLHVDLEVDPSREEEMVSNFRNVFEPAIRKQPGFVEVKLLKWRKALAGAGPASMKYRLLISFETEEHRLKWVATDTHQKVWPEVGKTLVGAKTIVLLYDVV